MKIFIDTANIEHIRQANNLGIIDGVTTNPTLVAREGKDFTALVKEICSIVDGPVSAEVMALDYEEMLDEARALSRIDKNVVIKIPLIPDGLRTVKVLSREGVRTNVTLCFSANQALLAAKSGATYISPFIGRLDDISHIGMDIVRDIKAIYKNYGFKTEIIVASIRHPLHVLEAAKIGADIATVPYEALMKLVKHPLTDIGIQRFIDDWNKMKVEVK
ncbi:MAG: fructose-6-phosphate aldolase [Candidatus Omnitrophica bacterium]|nr:fructose-6-phosphate aldolase [Candidatus Omnitrophota bacterium]